MPFDFVVVLELAPSLLSIMMPIAASYACVGGLVIVHPPQQCK